MIVLVNPMLSAELVNSDSNYVILRQLLPALIERRPDWLFAVLWPTNSGDWKYYDDGTFRHPNVKRIPIYVPPNKMSEVIHFDSRQWEKLLGYKECIFDVVWNNVVEIGDLIRLFEPRYDSKGAMPQVVNFHHYPMHRSLPYPVERIYEHILTRQLCGSLSVAANVVNSDHCRDMLLDNAERYLSAEQAKRLARSLVKLPYGVIDVAAIERNAQPRHELPTFVWNHRFQQYKGWRKVFGWFDEIWAKRPGEFQVQVHRAAALDAANTVAHKPYVVMVDTPGYEDYLRALSRGHANITASSHESMCLAAIESMAFGQVLIAPDAVTFPEITGKSDGNRYPLLFRHNAEAIANILAVIDAPQMVESWGGKVSKWVRSQYDVQVTAGRIVELFDKVTDHDVVAGLRRLDEWESLIGRRDWWEMQELRRTVYGAVSREGKHIAAGQSFPSVKVKRVANALGYRDTWSAQGRLELVRGT